MERTLVSALSKQSEVERKGFLFFHPSHHEGA